MTYGARGHAHKIRNPLRSWVQNGNVGTISIIVTFEVVPGDSVLIPPNTPHCIETTGNIPLRILCCCSPAYSDEDTELLGG